jgi:hypothetical protein
MTRTTKQRLQDAHAAIAAIQRYVPTEALERLNDDLTRSAVERQLSIVREALRLALLQDPSLRHSWPKLDAAMARCDQLRDWENPGEVQELAEFVEGELQGWQERLAEVIGEAGDEEGEAGLADCRESEELGI